MKWPFGKRQLRYRSLREWIVAEKIPVPFSKITDRSQFDEVMNSYGELRKHLFDLHLKTLTNKQQELLAQGKHPSQSHSLGHLALPYAESLKATIGHLPFVTKVGVGSYHFDRNVLDVFVEGVELLDAHLLEIPGFYEGFEVLVLTKGKSEA